MRETASVTAQRVAAHRLTFRRPGPATGDVAADEALHRDVAAGVPVQDGPLRRYLAARTAFVDRAVLAWDGPQVLTLGAGYDGRSLRYARPGRRWFELDHPATAADKAARLARLGLPRDVVAVPADVLVDDVAGRLADAGFDRALPTLVVCEGLLAYLPRAAGLGLLAAAAVPRGRLVAEVALEPVGATSAVRAALRAGTAEVGEPMPAPWPRGTLVADLAGCGWRVERAVDARGEDLATSGLGAGLVTAAGSAA